MHPFKRAWEVLWSWGSLAFWATWFSLPRRNQLAATEPEQTSATIGRLLMMDYLLPFEVASLLLLGALIAATTLSRKEN